MASSRKSARSPTIGQIWSNNKLTLHFQVPLEKPIDPKKEEFVLKVYDPEFFIDHRLCRQTIAVDVVGKMPESCKLVVKPVPTDAELDQTRTMLVHQGQGLEAGSQRRLRRHVCPGRIDRMQSMMQLLRNLLMVFILAGFFVAPAMAQTASEPTSEIKIDKKKLLVQPRNADGSLIMVSFWEDPVLWVREKQQEFYGSMSGALRNIRTGSPYTAAWTLMLLSFGYGIFHAAGPGHGKTVISAWLLATENELKRGIIIAFLSSVIQALVAITLISVLLLFVASAGKHGKGCHRLSRKCKLRHDRGHGPLCHLDCPSPPRPSQPQTTITMHHEHHHHDHHP